MSNIEKEIRSIAIYVAMSAEAGPMIEHLGLSQVDPSSLPAFLCIYTGEYHGHTVSIIQPGKCKTTGVDNVGTVAAGVATYVGLEKLSPDLLINAGTAGGFRAKGAAVGDVFISSSISNHDRRIPIPGFDAYGRGTIESVPTTRLRETLGYKLGAVSTGNSLDHTERDDQEMLANDASVKDMEAAAVAWTAQIFGTPMFAIKVVTDIVDGDRPSHEEFLENLHAAAASLQRAIPECVRFLIGLKLSEL